MDLLTEWDNSATALREKPFALTTRWTTPKCVGSARETQSKGAASVAEATEAGRGAAPPGVITGRQTTPDGAREEQPGSSSTDGTTSV